MIITKKSNQKIKKELTITKFKQEYQDDIDSAIQDFIESENKKQEYLPKFLRKNIDASDFYLNLHFNFNHHNNKSEWFIEKI